MRGVMLYELHLPNVMLGNRWSDDYNDDDVGGGVVVVVGGGGGRDDALQAPLAQCDAWKQMNFLIVDDGEPLMYLYFIT